MRWVGSSFVVVVGVFSVVSVQAAPTAMARPDLPVAVASFPAEAAPAVAAPVVPAVASPAPVAADASYPAQLVPAAALPAVPPAPASGPPTAPAPAVVVPPPVAPVSLDACASSRSAMDLALVGIGVVLRDAGGVFAALQAIAAPNDTQEIQQAADVEVRRIAFMRQLAASRDEEDQRAFDEKLSLYLRKRAFLQGLEARQSAR